jgi:hypothetical protein
MQLRGSSLVGAFSISRLLVATFLAVGPNIRTLLCPFPHRTTAKRGNSAVVSPIGSNSCRAVWAKRRDPNDLPNDR